MTEYLFLYGTLLPELGLRNPIADAIRALETIGPARIRGRLYDLGEYPGAVLDDQAPAKIVGQLFVLPKSGTFLYELDQYEGFRPDDWASSLFVRRLTTAETADGQERKCWVYTPNRELVNAPVIGDGDYARFRKTRARH